MGTPCPGSAGGTAAEAADPDGDSLEDETASARAEEGPLAPPPRAPSELSLRVDRPDQLRASPSVRPPARAHVEHIPDIVLDVAQEAEPLLHHHVVLDLADLHA
eukprot:17927-Pyramimonas_sp.AAC.1